MASLHDDLCNRQASITDFTQPREPSKLWSKEGLQELIENFVIATDQVCSLLYFEQQLCEQAEEVTPLH
jgi:hypothetical protein